MVWVRLILLNSVATFLFVQVLSSDNIVCYYQNAIGYNTSLPEDLNASLCTHINYAFITLNDDGNLKLQNKKLNIGKRMVNLKYVNSDLKILLSVGGVAAKVFSSVAADPDKRANLITSAKYYIQTYFFDGLDIDWEKPKPHDAESFIRLLSEIRKEFDKYGWLLTAAVYPNPSAGYNITGMSQYIDMFNVMTYNFYGGWSSYTGQNAALYPSPVESNYEKAHLNLAHAVQNWITGGAPKDKLNAGLAFYGRSFTLVNSEQHGLHAPITGAGRIPTPFYYQICKNYNNWTTEWDDDQKNPFKYLNDQWLGYDNEQSIKQKFISPIEKNITMNNHWELTQWFKIMGYDGEIPDSLGNICNNSTGFLWEKLMQMAQPKQEADNVKHNIMIHRLKSKPLNKQYEFPYPIKNIDTYIKKQSLEKKLENLNSTIKEKRDKMNSLSQNNKIKYVTIEKLKSRIKDNKERLYLLDRKCKSLEQDIVEVQDTLTVAKNLTPVELDENPNTKEITETLQRCAEKLEKHLQAIRVPNNQNSTQKSLRLFHSAHKPTKSQPTFEKYLIMSERKHSQNMSTLKRDMKKNHINNKENVNVDIRINDILFTSNEQSTKSEKNKRESLGILPDSCLNDFDILEATFEDDAFSLFTSNSYALKEINHPLSLKSGKQSISCSANAAFNSHQSLGTFIESRHIEKRNHFEVIYKDEYVTSHLKKLLCNHNRQRIWDTVQLLKDSLNLDVMMNEGLECAKPNKSQSVSSEDIAKLHHLHINTELQILKLRAVFKYLSSKINKKKQSIYAAISEKGLSPERFEGIIALFEHQLDGIALDASLAEMQTHINSGIKVEDNRELQITLCKISQTKEEIFSKISSIKQYISKIYKTLQSTSQTREMTVACVRKLGPFVENLNWSTRLTEKLNSNEVKTFECFPLEYNRRCIYTDSRIYYRDITETIPADIELDSESLYMLTNIIESPFNPPETVLLDILKSKMKLDALKSFPKYAEQINYRKYSLKELQAQESYVQYALDKFNSIMYSTSSNETLSTAEYMKRVMEIWLEMPLKEFVSPNRTFEGKEYKYYEKQYDGFYNDFK